MHSQMFNVYMYIYNRGSNFTLNVVNWFQSGLTFVHEHSALTCTKSMKTGSAIKCFACKFIPKMHPSFFNFGDPQNELFKKGSGKSIQIWAFQSANCSIFTVNTVAVQNCWPSALTQNCSIVSPIFAVLSLGRSPTSRSHSFPASTHSLAMRAGNAMCENRCKSMRVPIHGKNRKRFCFAIMTMHDYAIT